MLNSARDPQRVALAAAIGGGFLLGAFYTDARFFDPVIHTTVAWAKDWQTLITGIFAIAAALIATHPVYKQLFEVRKQSAAMSIEALRARGLELGSELAATRTILAACGRAVSWCERNKSADYKLHSTEVSAETLITSLDAFESTVDDIIAFEHRDPTSTIYSRPDRTFSEEIILCSLKLRSYSNNSRNTNRFEHDIYYIVDSEFYKRTESLLSDLNRLMTFSLDNFGDIQNRHNTVWRSVRHAEQLLETSN